MSIDHLGDPPPAVTQAASLEVKHLTCGYGRINVLRDVSLSVPAGSVSALLGPNGAGKSTLMKTIAGVIRPSSGSIELGGLDITALSPSRRNRIGMCTIPEGRGIFRSLTVRENLTMQARRGEEALAIDR